MKNLIKKAAKATFDFIKNHKVSCVIGGTVIAGAMVVGNYWYKSYKQGIQELRGEDIQVDISEEEINDLKEKKIEEEE